MHWHMLSLLNGAHDFELLSSVQSVWHRSESNNEPPVLDLFASGIDKP